MVRSTFIPTFAFIALTACSADPARVKAESMQRAEKYAAEQKYKEAIVEYRRAIQADPNAGEARKHLANAYLETGDFSNALRETIRAADLLPRDTEVQIRAGNMLLAAGQFEDARSRADRALARSPRSADAHVLRGNALAGLRDLDAALSDFEKAAAAAPGNGLIHTNIAAIHLAKGSRDQAEASFRKATELAPGSALAHVAYANFLLATNRPGPAETELKTAATSAPADPLVHRALAALYMFTERPREAESHLRTLADLSTDSKARFALARYYLAMNRRDDAYTELSRLASTKESYADATLQLAAARYADGQTSEARRLLREVQQRFPQNAAGHVLNAQFLLHEQQWSDAAVAAQTAIDRDPRLVDAFFALGLAQQGDRRFEDARKAFNEVLRLEPNAPRAQVALANLLLAMRDGETAQQLATQAMAGAPHAAEPRITLVRAQLANGDLDGAQAAIGALKADFPSREEPLVLEGTMFLNRKDYPAAERAFVKAAAIAPASLAVASGRVQVLLATRRQDDARRLVEGLTTSDRRPDALILAARTYSTLREFAPAEPLLRQVIAMDPSRTEAYSMLAQLFMLQNKLDDALREYQGLAAREPKSISAHTMIGTIHQMRSRRAEAKAAYRTVLAINGASPVAANNLAWMMTEDAEDLDVALQLAQAAKAGLPDSADAADTLGSVYLKKGLFRQAIAEFREAAGMEPARAAFKYRLGQAYAQNGDLAAARQTLEAALATEPTSRDALAAKSTLVRLAGLGS